MIGTLILSHGRLAEELLLAGRRICGSAPRVEALALEWDEELEQARLRLSQTIAALDFGQGVLVLADLPGGTPANLALELASTQRIEVISGVNLPMVMRLMCYPKEIESLPELAAWIAGKGRESIRILGTPSGPVVVPTFAGSVGQAPQTVVKVAR